MTRILVADDDRTTRTLVSELLRGQKFVVVTACDGGEALKKLKEDRFDLALLDVRMPKKNGIEVLAALRKAKDAPKVIVMTSDDAPETLLGAIREQAYKYIAKPIDPQTQVVSARPEWIELLLPCSLETAERIEGFMAHLKTGLSEEASAAVGQAFHELLLNAVEWGGKLDENRKVRISCLHAKRMVLYRIADPGPGFKLTDLSHAAITHDENQPTEHDEIRQKKGLRPGGFGLVLVKANVDELLYNEAQNEVVFVKYLDS
jgi:CheY-like chemotaxis protein